MSLSNEQIVDAIAGKTLMEVMELVKAIEEKFGVSAAAPVVAAAGPAAAAAPPSMQNGTSAPNAKPSAINCALSRPHCHKRFKAINTVAASELPPPKPPPVGMRLCSHISTPKGLPEACFRAAAAR